MRHWIEKSGVEQVRSVDGARGTEHVPTYRSGFNQAANCKWTNIFVVRR